MEDNDDDALYNYNLRERILSDDIKISENFTSEELFAISESLILR